MTTAASVHAGGLQTFAPNTFFRSRIRIAHGVLYRKGKYPSIWHISGVFFIYIGTGNLRFSRHGNDLFYFVFKATK